MRPLPVVWQRLMGRLKAFNGKPLTQSVLIMQPGDADRLSFSPDAMTTLFADGRFTIDFVVPGWSMVRGPAVVRPRGRGPVSRMAGPCRRAPRPEATLTLEPGSELSGTVEFEPRGARPPEDLTAIRVFERLVDGATSAPVGSAGGLRPPLPLRRRGCRPAAAAGRWPALPVVARTSHAGRSRHHRHAAGNRSGAEKLEDVHIILADITYRILRRGAQPDERAGRELSGSSVPVEQLLAAAVPIRALDPNRSTALSPGVTATRRILSGGGQRL